MQSKRGGDEEDVAVETDLRLALRHFEVCDHSRRVVHIQDGTASSGTLGEFYVGHDQCSTCLDAHDAKIRTFEVLDLHARESQCSTIDKAKRIVPVTNTICERQISEIPRARGSIEEIRWNRFSVSTGN